MHEGKNNKAYPTQVGKLDFTKFTLASMTLLLLMSITNSWLFLFFDIGLTASSPTITLINYVNIKIVIKLNDMKIRSPKQKAS